MSKVDELDLSSLTSQNLVKLKEKISLEQSSSVGNARSPRAQSAISALMISNQFVVSFYKLISEGFPPYSEKGSIPQDLGYLLVDIWGRCQGIAQILEGYSQSPSMISEDEIDGIEVLNSELIGQVTEVIVKFGALERFGAILDTLRAR